MISWQEIQAARRHGSLTAQRARRRLQLPNDRRVEIFRVIEAEGIWLMFQPLDALYGFYRRMQDAAGIVINAKHPMSLQRFTAAHEYGHHVLGHAYSVDEERDLEGSDADLAGSQGAADGVGDPRQEAAAQAFAATFLMPIQVVNRALVGRGFDRNAPQLSALDVYELSLEFGTSFSATLTQLAALEKIGWDRAQELRRRPLELKSRLGGGRAPADPRADVWLVRADDGGRDLPMRVGDEVVIELPENPSTGYAWSLVDEQMTALEVVDDSLEADSEQADLFGGTAIHNLTLRARQPGAQDLQLKLGRPWEPDPVRTTVVHASVGAPPTGEADHGLVEWQQRQRIAVA